MGKLKEYKELAEKESYFTCHKIDDLGIFKSILLSNKSNSIWRGSTESKYKLYTSLQRYWIQNDYPDDFDMVVEYLKEVITNAKSWNNGFIERYFSNYKILAFSNYAILSILRHHGTPTPIIDFTHNKLIALFFACDRATDEEIDKEIDSYCSVYEVKEDHFCYQFDSKVISFEYYKSIEKELRELNKDHEGDPDFILKFYQGYLNNDALFFAGLDKPPIFKVQDVKEDEFYYYINNNYNITNQEGLFIANLSPLRPLEDAIVERVRDMGVKERELIKDVIVARKHSKDNFHCYEINKKLRPEIVELLSSQGINRNYIYPDLREMGETSYKHFKL